MLRDTRRLALALLFGFVAGCSEPRDPRPDVILITVDGWRADRLGATGRDGSLTPNLDALAAEAIVFARAMAPVNSPAPAVASLLTGVQPHLHGTRSPADPLSNGVETLAERLGRDGYRTIAYRQREELVEPIGRDRGFDLVLAADGEPVSGADPPRFLWLHDAGGLPPFQLTRQARTAMGSYRGALSLGARAALIEAFGSSELPATEENRRALSALYDGMIHAADARIGLWLDRLRDHGLLDHAIILVAGTTGLLLGEHGRAGFAEVPWQPLLEVPLLLSCPGQSRSRRIENRVSLLDIVPTVLDRIGVAPDASLPGRSLSPWLEGRTPDPGGISCLGIPARGTVSVGWIEGPFKILVDRKRLLRFRLDRDPGELAPIPDGSGDEPTFSRLAIQAAELRALEDAGPAVR